MITVTESGLQGILSELLKYQIRSLLDDGMTNACFLYDFRTSEYLSALATIDWWMCCNSPDCFHKSLSKLVFFASLILCKHTLPSSSATILHCAFAEPCWTVS